MAQNARLSIGQAGGPYDDAANDDDDDDDDDDGGGYKMQDCP